MAQFIQIDVETIGHIFLNLDDVSYVASEYVFLKSQNTTFKVTEASLKKLRLALIQFDH